VVNEERQGSNTMLEISHKSSAKGAFLHFGKKGLLQTAIIQNRFLHKQRIYKKTKLFKTFLLQEAICIK
jgi:hypothetical protein